VYSGICAGEKGRVAAEYCGWGWKVKIDIVFQLRYDKMYLKECTHVDYMASIHLKKATSRRLPK